MTYGMQADGPVHGLGADFDLYSSIHQEVRLGVAVSRAVRAERVAERDRCARIADDCFNRGVWPGEIAAKIRSGE